MICVLLTMMKEGAVLASVTAFLHLEVCGDPDGRPSHPVRGAHRSRLEGRELDLLRLQRATGLQYEVFQYARA